MTNPVHLLSVAALLLAAFLVGAIVGTLARLIALRSARKPAAAVEVAVAAVATAPPLVAAPVIAPLPVAPTPVTPPPAEVPVPDFAATLIALANETPPASFVEATKPRVELTPEPQPAVRPVPALEPVPRVEPVPPATMQPAHVAGETTSGVHVAAPQHEAPPPVLAQPEPVEQRTAEVILFPSAATESASPRPTAMMVGGETVALVDASDFAVAAPEPVPAAPEAKPVVVNAKPELGPAAPIADEDNFLFVGTPVAPKAELVAVVEPTTKTETIPVPVIVANAAVGAVVAAELSVPEVIETPSAPTSPVEPLAAAALPVATVAPPPPPPTPEPVVSVVAPAPVSEAAVEEPEPEPALPAPAAEASHQSAPAAAASEPIAVSLDETMDEDAAMRAIEGNWSPRRAPPKRPARAAAEPEGANQAVAASARAVIAARRTAEAVVAEVAEVKVEAGRPIGLDAPRDGRKDDLTHIIGVLPVIETALNKLGIYHFDQMGALTDENISWIEGHLGLPGRIGRELWREQARELSAVLRPKRAAES